MAKKKTSTRSKGSSTECVTSKCEKKKLGRPKGSKNKSVGTSTECVTKKKGKKRGKVSTSSVKTSTKISTSSKGTSTECDIKKKGKVSGKVSEKRGRGRPRKHQKVEEIDTSNLRTLCFIGYCTECHGMITTGDYEEGKKTIYKCMSCGNRDRITNLTEYKKPSKKPKSKKAFLKDISGVHKELDVETHHVPDEFVDIVENINSADEWN
jgi:hypothetical protein